MSRFPQTASRRARWRWMPLVAGLLAAAGCVPNSAIQEGPQAQAGSEPIAVTLRVDFPGSEDLESEVRVGPPATVSTVLEQAAADQVLTYQARGDGDFWFLESINQTANRGAEGDNWIFLVNDQLGQASAGASPVAAGDQVIWRFGAQPSWSPQP